MNHIFISISLSFIITFFAIPIIIQIAKEKKLFDEPDERKIHKAVIPTLGGLGIFSGFMLSFLLSVPSFNGIEIQYFIAAFFIIFLVGIKDDILIISASKKFIGQLIAALIIIKFGGIQLNNMYGFLGIYQIPEFAATILTLFTIVVITNSFNLIDGVDGLAGSLGLLSTIIFGSYFYYTGQYTFSILSFALTGSLISFLIYNFPPAKIFMGDTGSLLIGIVNSILVIKFINVAQLPDVKFHLSSSPAIGFAILVVPLFDTLRVFAIRIFAGRSPFSPDRNHIHHLLLDLGLSHKSTTLICITANIGVILTAISLEQLGNNMLMIILFLISSCLLGVVLQIRKNRKKKFITNDFSGNQIVNKKNVFSLYTETIEID
jgi:UDP-N-acetylmuramyl pentapeptide phosphotransferase/UDP-N-acetylglucosamine-1-phosphate transferase